MSEFLRQLRDWQSIKQAQAIEAAGTPEAASLLAESKRYGTAADELERIKKEARRNSLNDAARIVEEPHWKPAVRSVLRERAAKIRQEAAQC